MSDRLMTRLTIVGIAIAVATLLVTLSIVGGFGTAYQQGLLDFNAHIVIIREGEIDGPAEWKALAEQLTHPAIAQVTPFFYREGMLVGEGRIRGVALKGIDPAEFRAAIPLRVELDDAPDPETALARERAGAIPILVGAAAGVAPGARLHLFLPRGGDWRAPTRDDLIPVTVVGRFASGLYDYDSQFVFMNLAHLQRLFGQSGRITGVELRLRDPEEAPLRAAAIQEALPGPYSVTPWQELHQPILAAIRLERLLLGLITAMLVAVAAFNILATVLLHLLKQHRSIAILRAIGLSARRARARYFLKGLRTGAIGVGVGLLLGAGVAWSLGRFQWIPIPPEVYFLAHLPVHLDRITVGMVAAFGLAIAALAAGYAARKVTELPLQKGLKIV